MNRDERLEARREIVQAANRHILYASRVRGVYGAKTLGMRQLQWAVRVVRHNRSVAPAVLEAAGFRPA